MRHYWFALGLLVLSGLPFQAFCAQPDEINRLIELLGDRRFAVREAASSRLQTIGKPAAPALRLASRSSKDPEIRRRAGLLARLCGEFSDVEGRYILAVGLTLEIRDDGSFFTWWGEGTINRVDGWLMLEAKKKPARQTFPWMPTTLLPVRWGPRTYLLAKDELLEFCNAINQKTEPRTRANGTFLLREGEWRQDVEGSPALPKDWSDYLLAKPIQAQVLQMVDARTGKLNVGKAQGIRPGMVLQNGQNNRFPCMVRVVAVEGQSCLIRELNELIVPDIKVGDRAGSQRIPEPATKSYLEVRP